MAPRELLQSLKACAGGQHQLCLAVGTPVVAILRPVATCAGRLRIEDVELLTKWRNRHVSSFLTEFTATPERTASWLTRMVGPDDTRILFMVESPPGRTVGYMGLAFIDWQKASGEADAVVRGDDAPRGSMTQCLRHMLAWARDQLGISALSVRVRSDNPALAFYQKFGYREVLSEPLMKTECNGDVIWQPGDRVAPTQALNLVHMRLDPNALPSPTPAPQP